MLSTRRVSGQYRPCRRLCGASTPNALDKFFFLSKFTITASALLRCACRFLSPCPSPPRRRSTTPSTLSRYWSAQIQYKPASTPLILSQRPKNTREPPCIGVTYPSRKRTICHHHWPIGRKLPLNHDRSLRVTTSTPINWISCVGVDKSPSTEILSDAIVSRKTQALYKK